jgi:PadR family transcriptional regulator PadR
MQSIIEIKLLYGGMHLNDIGKQLKKGVLEILVLKLLRHENMYGYQLIQELDNKSDGVFKIKDGTLYPILYRLEDNKFIENFWETSNDKRGVPRKYYKLTEKGKLHLDELTEEWLSLINASNLILDGEFD